MRGEDKRSPGGTGRNGRQHLDRLLVIPDILRCHPTAEAAVDKAFTNRCKPSCQDGMLNPR
jgi:hypothetical protein